MKLKKILTSKYFVFLLFLLISLGIHLLATGGRFNVIINGGDTDYPLNPIIEISNSLFAWKNEALGTPEFFPLSRLLLSIIPLLNYVIFGLNSNLLIFVFLWSLAGFAMYLLVEKLTRNKLIAFIVGLFYMMNPYSYLRYHTPTLHIQYSYSIPPLLLFVLLQTTTSKLNLKWGTLIYSILMLFLIRTINLWGVFWMIIPVFGYLLMNAGIIKDKISGKKMLILLFTSLILNLAVIFMAFSSSLNFIGETQKNVLINYYRETQEKISKGYNLLESLGGWGTYAWQNIISEEKPGWQAFSILGNMSKVYLLLLSLVVPIFTFMSNLKLRKLPLLIFVFALLFLMTGQGAPLGLIYTRLFSEIPIYKDLFRDTWGYWGGVYMFILSILFSISLKNNFKFGRDNKYVSMLVQNVIPISIVIIAFSLSFILYIYPGKILHKSWISSVPQSYINMSEYINALPEYTRILPLPLTSQPFGYTETNWGYKGPDILNRLTKANILDKHLNSIANQGYIDLLNRENLKNFESIKKILILTGTDYVLLRKDFVDSNEVISPKIYSEILSDKCFSLSKDTELLSLYKFNCNQNSIPKLSYAPLVINGEYNCIADALTTKQILGTNPICLVPNQENSFIVENNLLINSFKSSAIIAKSNSTNNDISVNGRQLNGEIILNENNSINLDLSSKKYELFNFQLPKSTPNTCQNGVNTEGIVFINLQNRLGIISNNKQSCIFTKINNRDYSNSKAILKIDIESNNNSKSIVKFFSEKTKKDTLVIDLSIKDDFNTLYSIKEITNSNRSTYYIYFNDLSFIDNNTYIYLLLNTNEEYFVGDLYDLRMIELTKEFLDIKLVSSNLSAVDYSLKPLNYDSYFGGTILRINGASGKSIKAINLNNNFNSNWKILTISKNGNINLLDEKNHFIANGWSNGWNVDKTNVENIWIIYIPQIIYLVGILLSIIAILSFFLIA